MNRRNFIRLVGGGAVAAATAGSLGACSSAFPGSAVEAWQGPGAAEADPRRHALAYAILAPNPHNRQPWLVDLREPEVITLYCDAGRLLPETDPFGRQILVGHGAFIELLVLALAEQGLGSELMLWPQGELPAQLVGWQDAAAQRQVARIRVLPRGSARPDTLFTQVLARHTPKVDFDTSKSVAPATVQALMAAGATTGVQAGGTADAAQLEPLRALCWEAAKVELLTPRTVMESVRLTRVGPGEILRHRDGISINSPMIRAVDALGLFDRNHPPAEGSAGYKSMMDRFGGHSRTAMGFVWLSTGGNSRSEQIAAGRAYVRLQLKGTELGIGVHPMSQALQEFAEMRPHYERAHQLLLGKPAPGGLQDATVQMLCRLGYPAEQVAATPRRQLGDFVAA